MIPGSLQSGLVRDQDFVCDDLMLEGASRAFSHTYAASVRLPPRPPRLVYLDLLHWISLAKAHSGHRTGAKYKDVLDACLRAVNEGRAIFPISDAIYMEVTKIGPYRQRRDLADVIEEVSRYRVVTSRVVIAEHEVESLLDRVVGPNPVPINTMDYLDWGVARAFGKVGGFRIRSTTTGEDLTDEVRAKHPGGPDDFDRKLAKAELDLNRSSLRGPTPEEEPSLQELGWHPKAAFESTTKRAAQEIEQVQRFNANPAWRRGRIRDVIAAREIGIEINNILWRGLSARSVTLEAAFPDPGDTLRQFDSMPSFDVSVSLKTEFHRDPLHNWTPNDLLDIDALSSTLPYCDIVITDKAAAHAAKSVATRLHATVLSDIMELL